MVFIIPTIIHSDYIQGKCYILVLETCKWLRWNIWIVLDDFLKFYWSFIRKMIAIQNDHMRLKSATIKENIIFDNLVVCKAYLQKEATCNFIYSVILVFSNIFNILIVSVYCIDNFVHVVSI